MTVKGTLSKESKTDIIEGFLSHVYSISSKNFQRRVWLKGIGPEVGSLGEALMDMEPAFESFSNEYKRFGLTRKQRDLVVEFDKIVNQFKDTHNTIHTSLFIDSSDWEIVINSAQKVLKAFDYKPDSSFRYRLTIVRAYIYFFLRKFRKYTPLSTYAGRKFKIDYLDCIATITYKDLINSIIDIDDFGTLISKLTWTYREITGAPIFYELTENQKVLLSALGKEADTFYDSITDKKPLDYYRNSKEWEEIEALAEVVIEAFEYKPRRLKPPLGVYDYEKKLSPLELFLLNVEKVANKRYQKRVWIREVGPEWDTYYQTAKKLLKLNDPTLLNSTLSEKQKEAIENFYDLFERFHWDSSYYPEWFIDHVKWKKLTALAKDVIKAFNYKRRRGPIYWTRVFFSYIRYFLGKFKNLKLTPSPSPYR